MINLKAIIFCMFMMVLIIVGDSYRWWRKFKQPKNVLIKNVFIDTIVHMFMWLTVIICPILEKSYLYVISALAIFICTYIIWLRRLFTGYNHNELSYETSKRLSKIARQGVVMFEITTIITATLIWVFCNMINKM